MNEFNPPDPYETMTDIPVISSPIPFASFADFEVEFELIGSILKKGSIFEEVSGQVNPDIFHNSICADIFRAMGKVREHGLVLDAVTVGDQLERDGRMDTIIFDVFTGRAAIGKIRERGSAKNYLSYVEIVIDYWAKRRIDELSQALVKQARNGRRAVDILSDFRVSMDDLDTGMGNGITNDTSTSRELANILYDHADQASKGELRGCPTGFPDLDSIMTMMGGDIIIAGGRPGQGKSALLITIAVQVSKNIQKRVGIFSLEMSKTQVTARIASHLSGVPSDMILKGKMQDNQWPVFVQAIEEIEHLPISINDRAGLTVPQLRAGVKRMIKDLGGLDLIVVDYAQLMKSTKKNYKNRNEEIGEITKGLKVVAKEFDVPILIAAQMNRAVEARADKRPVLSDLRESGDLENDADIVMFLYEPTEDGKSGVRELIVAKHRNGPVGVVELIFKGALTKFESATKTIFIPNETHHWQNRADMGDD